MPHVRSLLAGVVLAASLAGCAGTTTSQPNGRAERLIAPRMVSRIPMELRTAGDLRLEVLVKADGRPDLRTLKISGTGERIAVERWLTSSVFEPGRQGGVPVDAVFSMRIKTRVEVRRM